MLYHITQVHTPENCPVGDGGSNSLFDPNVDGVRLIGRYGANSEHTLFLVVETDDWQALQKFLGQSPWDHEPLLDELVRQVGTGLGEPCAGVPPIEPDTTE